MKYNEKEKELLKQIAEELKKGDPESIERATFMAILMLDHWTFEIIKNGPQNEVPY